MGAQMPKIEILVKKFDTFDVEFFTPPPNGPAVGDRAIFSNDLQLERYNNRTPGNGPNDLPQDPAQRRAGTHSGSVTILRIAAANDRFFPPGSFLMEYDATYRFNDLATTPLQKGQVTARGVFLTDSNFNEIDTPNTFAITGGTDVYELARGQIVEPNANDRLLKLDV
jgi:hypothetical protein